jgi:hypothetical protein
MEINGLKNEEKEKEEEEYGDAPVDDGIELINNSRRLITGSEKPEKLTLGESLKTISKTPVSTFLFPMSQLFL